MWAKEVSESQKKEELVEEAHSSGFWASTWKGQACRREKLSRKVASQWRRVCRLHQGLWRVEAHRFPDACGSNLVRETIDAEA